MKYEDLRPYQKKICDTVQRALLKGGVIVQSPARSGKSKIIAYLVEKICLAGKTPLVLTHRDKIQKQLIEHCSGISIDSKTDHIFISAGKCYVAMTQTLAKRPNILSQLLKAEKNIILLIDECHMGDFNRIMGALPQALRIGFSATPVWKLAKWLPDYYKSLVHGPQIRELVALKNIVPVRYFEMVSDLEGLKRAANGEFTEDSQTFAFDKAKLYDGLFDELAKFTFNKCAIFCGSKKSADKLAEQFAQDGRWQHTKYYSGCKSYELAKFTELGLANVLITVRSLGTGWDYPPLDFQVLWCAIGSIANYLQTAARACTPHPGKPIVTELDFGGNNSRFGGKLNLQAMSMDRDWNVLWQPPPVPERTGSGVPSVAVCPSCEFMHSSQSKACPNCGYIYPVAEVALRVGELAEIRHNEEAAKAAVQQMVGRRISTLSPQELAAYAKEKNKKPFCARVAKSAAIKDEQFLIEYGKALDYKEGWAKREIGLIKDEIKKNKDYKIDFYDAIVK